MLPWWYLSVLLLNPALGFPLSADPDGSNSTKEHYSVSDPADLGNNTMPRSDCNNSTSCKPETFRTACNQTHCIALRGFAPHHPIKLTRIWLPTMIKHQLDGSLRPGDMAAGDTSSPFSPGKK